MKTVRNGVRFWQLPHNWRVLFWCLRRRIIPFRLSLYGYALTHASCSTTTICNVSAQRLEYLGDSVLGMVVSEWLYNTFPSTNEGVLTDLRSKIVNNRHLAELAVKIGVDKALLYQGKLTYKMLGNVLEAVVGAIFLDRGLRVCRRFVRKQLLSGLSLEDLQANPMDYKGYVIQWAQHHQFSPRFESTTSVRSSRRSFEATLHLGEAGTFVGEGSTKKQAEQQASRQAYLQIDPL